MSFEILIHDDLSLAASIKISKEGGVVLKTPHVGNIYPNNLLIASLGIPTLFYDRTLGIKDSNFHPDKIIFSGRCESIADPHILTTHARITRVPDVPSALLEKENIAVGTGLGLHLSKQVIEAHGGYIWVESEGISKGAKFFVGLPLV